jgi:hypothetical protein
LRWSSAGGRPTRAANMCDHPIPEEIVFCQHREDSGVAHRRVGRRQQGRLCTRRTRPHKGTRVSAPPFSLSLMLEADLFMVSSDSIHKLNILTARSERHSGVMIVTLQVQSARERFKHRLYLPFKWLALELSLLNTPQPIPLILAHRSFHSGPFLLRSACMVTGHLRVGSP